MDPITIITGLTAAAGFVTSMMGSSSAQKASAQAAKISQDITQQEMKQDDLRRQAMEVSANRQRMEILRNAQRVRSLGHAAAVGQGAQFGSVTGGAAGAVSGSSNTNLQGVDISQTFGEQMFDINKVISGDKIQLAGVQSQLSSAQGQMQLGNSLTNAAGLAGKLGGSAFGGAGKFFGGGGSTGDSGGGKGSPLDSFMSGGIWPA